MKPKPHQPENKYNEMDIRQAGSERGFRFLADIARDIPISAGVLYKYCRNEAPLSDENRHRIEHWVEAKR